MLNLHPKQKTWGRCIMYCNEVTRDFQPASTFLTGVLFDLANLYDQKKPPLRVFYREV